MYIYIYIHIYIYIYIYICYRCAYIETTAESAPAHTNAPTADRRTKE